MRKYGHAIFDMDGTMLDSMPAWKKLGRDYLIGKGKVMKRQSKKQSKSRLDRHFKPTFFDPY